ncbi:MAG: hypothetical protein ACI4WM_08740 [Erysipelotrichaceae bacterium]
MKGIIKIKLLLITGLPLLASLFLSKKTASTVLCIIGIIYVAGSIFNGWGHSSLNGYNPGIMKSIRDDKDSMKGMLDVEMLIGGVILVIVSIFVF